MFQKMIEMLKKRWDIVSYLFFGVLTTAVNYAVYLPCYNILHFSAAASNMISWTVAVAFAYLTNKSFVFKSHDWSLKTVGPEFMKFISCRIASGALETANLYVAVDLLCWNGNVWKLITSVLVVIINYLASKLVVFTGR